MNVIFKPLLFGLIIGISVYAIIKASKDNPTVIKKISIIVLSISIILSVIMLFFLLFSVFN